MELLTLKDDTVTPAGLPRPGCDLCKETATCKLVIKCRLERPMLLPLCNLTFDMVRFLRIISRRSRRSFLQANLHAIVGLVPGLVRVRVHQNNSSLDEGLCPDKLVIGCIVGDIENTNLASANLSSPREIARVEAEGTELQVPTAAPNGVDTLLTDLGHGSWPAHLKLALLAVLFAAPSGLAALVPSLTCDTLLAETGETG